MPLEVRTACEEARHASCCPKESKHLGCLSPQDVPSSLDGRGEASAEEVTSLVEKFRRIPVWQALHLRRGCVLVGPAATGKTGMIKDLAAALGKCCYIFNCSPEMNYESLGDLLKGGWSGIKRRQQSPPFLPTLNLIVAAFPFPDVHTLGFLEVGQHHTCRASGAARVPCTCAWGG